MTECSHSNTTLEVKANGDSLLGIKKCKDCEEVIKEVTVERNVNDLLDTVSAQEVLDQLKEE
jgi:hypothetical protein